MSRHDISRVAIAALLLLSAAPAGRAQTTVINLNSVIGPSGTDAASVQGTGQAVNYVYFASNSGATALTAPGSTGSSSFDFNSSFSDHLDRATGSNPNSGAAHVFADRKYDSGSPSALILDLNNDGVFSENAVPGFGMHSDGFVTFDLAVIRTNSGLAANTPFVLTGVAGMANAPLNFATSGAIIADSTQLAVFDWGTAHAIDSFSLSLTGSTRYVTFIGLSGLDKDNIYAHVGFGNVQLSAIPEPSTLGLLALGLAALGLGVRRRTRL